jgi:outer membrane protein
MKRWFVAVLAVLLAPGWGWSQSPGGDGSTLRVEDVVAMALASHPSLEAARSRSAAAKAAVGEAWATRLPTMGATALATRFQEPMVVAPLHGIDPMNLPAFERTLVQGHAGAEWLLFDGGQTRSRVGGAERLAGAAVAAADGAADAVVVEAVTSYLEALTARAVLAAHELQLAALESELGRADQMFEEGRAPRVQVLRTEAVLSRALAEREAAAERVSLAHHRLARVSGLDAPVVAASTLRELAASPVPPADRAALVMEARAGHPAVEQATLRASSATLALSGTRSLWLPRVSLTGRYSAYGSTNTDFQPEWQLGTQVSYPIYVGGARARAVDRAEAEARAARWELAAVVREVEDAVDATLAAYRSALSRAAALEAAVAQSAEVARIEALALEAGAGVQTDYLRAEADLLSARAALAEARHGAAAARVRLARATGRLGVDRLGDLLVEVEP